MRFDPQKSFGYPVLRKNSDDYIDADINASVELVETITSHDTYLVEYQVMIGVAELRAALRSKQVLLVVNFACPRTLYSDTFIVSDLSGAREIDMRDIRGDLIISLELVVATDTFRLKSTKFHTEFGGSNGVFELVAGDLIAQASPMRIFIEREVFQTVMSLFDWKIDEDIIDGAWRLEPSDDVVFILLNKNQRDLLGQLENSERGQNILLNSIFFAAVVQLIQQILDDEDNETLWARTIQTKFNAMGIFISKKDDPIELAQKLLKYPLVALNNTELREEA
jgi:hypothetical protein